jgi:hypothetical protein
MYHEKVSENKKNYKITQNMDLLTTASVTTPLKMLPLHVHVVSRIVQAFHRTMELHAHGTEPHMGWQPARGAFL